MNGHRAPFWVATLFLALLLLCAFGMAFALDHPQVPTPIIAPIDAVYFTTGRSPVLPQASIRASGIRSVATFDALQREATTTDALIIDRELLPLIPQLWLAQQQRAGKLIIGINIPLVELGRLAEYAGGIGGYLDSYGGRDFYSYLFDLGGCGTNQRDTGSEAISSTERFLGIVRNATERSRCTAR